MKLYQICKVGNSVKLYQICKVGSGVELYQICKVGSGVKLYQYLLGELPPSPDGMCVSVWSGRGRTAEGGTAMPWPAVAQRIWLKAVVTWVGVKHSSDRKQSLSTACSDGARQCDLDPDVRLHAHLSNVGLMQHSIVVSQLGTGEAGSRAEVGVTRQSPSSTVLMKE